MSYLIVFHWAWLFALILGVVAGWMIYQPIRTRRMGLLWVVAPIVVVGIVVAISTLVLGGPGYQLEAAMPMIGYVVGCPLGWALRRLAFVDPVSEGAPGFRPTPGYTFRGGTIPSPGAPASAPSPGTVASPEPHAAPSTVPSARPATATAPVAVRSTIEAAPAIGLPPSPAAPSATPADAPAASGPTAAAKVAAPAPTGIPASLGPEPSRTPSHEAGAPTAATATDPASVRPIGRTVSANRKPTAPARNAPAKHGKGTAAPGGPAQTVVPEQAGATPSSPVGSTPAPSVTPNAPASATVPAADTPQRMGAVPDQDRHCGTRPEGWIAARDDKPDDLKRIRGIGPQNEGRMHGLGIWHFDQIAAWTPDNVKWVGSYLAFPGRIDREQWIEQAKGLASGHPAEFSKRVAAGHVTRSLGDGSLGHKNVVGSPKPAARKR